MAGEEFVPLEPVAARRPALRRRREGCRSTARRHRRPAFAAAIDGSTAPACASADEVMLAVRRHGRRSTPKAASPPPEACAIHRDRIKRRARRRSTRTFACASSAAAPWRPRTTSTVCASANGWCGPWMRGLPRSTRSSCRPRRSSRPCIADVADPERLRRAQRAAAAQYRDRQLLRPVRHLAAAAGARFRSG